MKVKQYQGVTLKNFVLGLSLIFVFNSTTLFAQAVESSRSPEIKQFTLNPDLSGFVDNAVNLYTGDLNLPVKLAEIAGRNGLGINITATYNSNIQHIRDIWALDAPTGILGLGWTLDYDKIVIDHKQTGARDDDDYYLISGGVSNKLIPTGNESSSVILFETQNYQFWAIRYFFNDERWEIIKEDGTTYVFGGGVSTSGGLRQSVRNTVQWGVKWGNWIGHSGRTSGQQQHAIAWNISKVKNQWGDELLYEYDQVMEDVGRFGQPDNVTPKKHTKASYLKKITTPEGKSISLIYQEKLSQEYTDPYASVVPFIVNITGPSFLSTGTGQWTAGMSGGSTPVSYSWQYMYTCHSSCSGSGVWYNGGTSTTFSYSYSSTIKDLSLKLTGTDSQNRQSQANHFVFFTSGEFPELLMMTAGDDSLSGDFSIEMEESYEEDYYMDLMETETTSETMGFETLSMSSGIPLDEADAFQEKFETRYLSSIEVRDEENNLIMTTEISYGFHGSPGAHNFKRLLTGVIHKEKSGDFLPQMKFEYYGTGSVHPAALRKITLPTGGEVTYNYSEVTIQNSFREKMVNVPTGFEKPRVFIGNDYVVTTWKKTGGTELSFKIYTWDGEWIEYIGSSITLAGEITNNKQNFEVFLEDDFFVVVDRYHTKTNTKTAHVFRKDPLKRGQWIRTFYSMSMNNTFVNVATGKNHFVFTDIKTGRIQRYFLNGNGWTTNTIAGTSMGNEYNFFLGGTNNYYVFDNKGASGPDILQIHYLDRFKQWQSKTISTSVSQFESSGNNQNYITAGNTYFAMANSGAHEYVFRLKEDYTVFSPLNLGHLVDSDPVYIIENSSVTFAQRVTTTNTKHHRFDGVTWRNINSFFNNSYSFGFGPDVMLKREGNVSEGKARYIKYDPNTSSWKPSVAVNVPTEHTMQRVGHRFFVTGNKTYYQKPDGNDQYLGLLTVPASGDKIKYLSLRTGLNFVAYDILTPSGTNTFTTYGAYVRFIKNGSYFGAALDIQESLVDQISSYQRSELVSGNTIVTHSKTASLDNSTNPWVKLYRVINDDIRGRQKDYPVTSIVVNSGFDSQTTTFTYTTGTATYDLTGSVAQYNKVRVTNGSGNGYTEHFFFNGHTNPSAPFPTGSFTNASSRHDTFKGLPYLIRYHDSGNNVIGYTENHWWGFDKIIRRISDQVTIDYGRYIRNRQTKTMRDGVEVAESNVYSSLTGLVSSNTVTNYNVDGQTETILTLYRYWWEDYDVNRQKNILSPVIRTETRINNTPVAVSVSTWKDWGGNKWAPNKSYVWKGTGSSVFDFANWSGSTEPGTDWLKSGEILIRDSFGNTLQQRDKDGVVSSGRFTSNGTQLLGSFANSSYDQTRVLTMDSFQSTSYGSLAESLIVYKNGNGTLAFSKSSDEINASSQKVVIQNLTDKGAGFYIDPTTFTANREYILEFDYKITEGKLNVFVQASGQSSSLSKTYDITGTWKRGHELWIFKAGEKIYFRAPYNGTGATNTTFFIDNIRIYPSDAYATTYSYLPSTGLNEAVFDIENGVTRYVYNHFYEASAIINSDNRVISQSGRAYSRELNSDVFTTAKPNRSTTVSYINGNPLRNAGFEIGKPGVIPDGWFWTSSMDATVSKDSFSGRQSLRARNTSSSAAGFLHARMYDPAYLKKGTAYKISFWAKEGNSGTTGMSIRLLKAQGTSSQVSNSASVTIDGNSWKRYTVTVTTSTSTTWDNLALSSHLRLDVVTPGHIVFIDDLDIQELAVESLPVMATSYTDGTGKPRQQQQWNGTGSTYIVSAVQFDALGRPWRSWRPYLFATGHAYDANFAANAQTHYGTTSGTRLYETTTYYNDPLSRVKTVQPAGNGTAIVQYIYGSVTIGGQLFAMTETIGLDGIKDQVITNRLGGTVRTVTAVGTADQIRSEVKSDPIAKTVTTRPPHFFAPPSESAASDWISVTEKDFLGRTIQSTTTDAGTIRMKYGNTGILRFSQDALQAASGLVTFRRYDSLKRPIASGESAATFSSLNTNQNYSFETDNLKQLQATAYDVKPSTGFPWTLFSTELNGITVLNSHGKLTAQAFKTSGKPGVGLSPDAANDKDWQLYVYSYDDRGRLSSKRIFFRGKAALNTVIEYSYDEADRVVMKKATVGSSQVNTHFYEYEHLSRLHKVFTAAGTLKPANPDVAYTYSAEGRMISRDVNGQTAANMQYNFDGGGRLASIVNGTGDFSQVFTYNSDFSIQKIDFKNSSGFTNEYSYAYTYDNLKQLKTAKYATAADPSGNAFDVNNLNYDKHGNILSLRRYYNPSMVDNLTYNYTAKTNRLASVQDAVSNPGVNWDVKPGSFTYDANGNMKTSTGRGITNVIYDLRNLPIEVHYSNGKKAEYRYNSEGWRIYKRVTQGSTTLAEEWYVMDGGVVLAVTDANGAVVYWNLYGNEQYGRREAGGAKKFTITDHLGSTRRVVNASGSNLEYYDYYPFGLVMRSNISGTPAKENFTGKEQDTESGYHYFGSRYYDAGLARWGVTDPAGQFHSPYAYANNPVSFVDPDGEFVLEAIAIGAMVGAFTGSMRAGMQGSDPYVGMLKGATVGAVGGALGAIGVGSSFVANFAMGVGQGALTGSLDAALWGGDIGRSALTGGVMGGAFATATSPQLKNKLKGQGFRSNDKVLADFVARGEHQDALKYFGFEGTYDASGATSKIYQADNYWGKTNALTGDISYGDLAFENYGTLKATYYKESFHSVRIKTGIGTAQLPKEYLEIGKELGFSTYLEEIKGYQYAYRNCSGLEKSDSKTIKC